MTAKELLKELKSLGTAQNVKIYSKHGAGPNLYGVSFANLEKLKKKHKNNHALALDLWETGNTDARTLALMIANPAEFTEKQAKKWQSENNYFMLNMYLGPLIAQTDYSKKFMEKLMKSKKEYDLNAAYNILCAVLKNQNPDISDQDAESYMKQIEEQIHSAPNRGRSSMNTALIAIGAYKPALTKKAIATAKRIGKVQVDHGDTSCKTPDAATYIPKAAERFKKKLEKAKAKKK